MLTSIAPSFMNQFGNWLKRLTQMENPWKHLCPMVPQNQSPLHICPPSPTLVFNFPEIRAGSIHFKLVLYIVLYIVTSISILG